MSGFGQKASKIGGLLKGAFAGAAVGAAFKSIVTAASDAQQSMGATETVFGKFAGGVVRDSKKAAQQFGLDASTYRENANLLGAIFSNQGVAAKKLGGATKEMIGVGSDLAATFGGTTTDAVGALSAAFKGEFDSLDKYGISLNATKIAAELAARGQDKLTGSALDAAKQQVTADLIMKQSAKTRGAFAKESNTLAGQQQRLSAQFTNMKAAIGAGLLPVMTSLASFINGTVLPAFTKFGPIIKDKIVGGFKELKSTVTENKALFISLGAGLAAAGAALLAYNAYVRITTAVTAAWNVVQKLLNGTMKANPVGIVITAIALLVGALVLAYQKSKTFRNIVNGAFNGIKKVTQAVFPVIANIIKTVFKVIATVVRTYIRIVSTVIKVAWRVISAVTRAVWNVIKNAVIKPVVAIVSAIRSRFNTAKAIMSAVWSAVKSKTVAMWNGIKSAVTSGISKVINAVKSVKGKVTGFFSGAGSWLKNAGAQLVQGIADGIASRAQAAIDRLKALAQKLKDLLPGSPVKTGPLTSWNRGGAGKRLIGMLAEGLSNPAELSKVKRAASRMAGLVDQGFGTPGLAIAGGSASSGAGVININVNVSPTADKAAVGREILGAIKAAERQGFRR